MPLPSLDKSDFPFAAQSRAGIVRTANECNDITALRGMVVAVHDELHRMMDRHIVTMNESTAVQDKLLADIKHLNGLVDEYESLVVKIKPVADAGFDAMREATLKAAMLDKPPRCGPPFR